MRKCVVHLAALALLTNALSACRYRMAVPPEPAAELRFARTFFQVLRDSGAAAVVPWLHPRAQRLPNIAANLGVMAKFMNEANAELELSRWTVRHVTGRPRATEVMFTSRQVGAPSEVGVWIQTLDGRLVVETFFAGPQVERGTTP